MKLYTAYLVLALSTLNLPRETLASYTVNNCSDSDCSGKRRTTATLLPPSWTDYGRNGRFCDVYDKVRTIRLATKDKEKCRSFCLADSACNAFGVGRDCVRYVGCVMTEPSRTQNWGFSYEFLENAPSISTTPSSVPSITPSASSGPSQAPSRIPSAVPSNVPSSMRSLAPSMTEASDNMWFLSNYKDVTETAISKDIIKINLPFNASYREISVDIFTKDCLTPYNDTTHPFFEAAFTTPVSSNPDGFVQFNVTLEMNVTSINGTNHFNEFTNGGRGGWVEVCVETSLAFKEDDKMGNDADTLEKVIFKNSVLNVTVSLTAAYKIDSVEIEREVEKKEKVNTDYSNFITAYECDEETLDPLAAPQTYNQGQEITICVTDNSNSIVEVEEFVNLMVTQDSDSYNFINDGSWNRDITSVVCTDPTGSDRRVCYAKIRALALFFSEKSPPALTIEGIVYVVRDGRRVMRNLHSALLPASQTSTEENRIDIFDRRVKEDNIGGFKVVVSLGSTDGIAASGGTIDNTDACFVAIAVGVTGAVLMA